MAKSAFDNWWSRSKEPKERDNRKTRDWGFEDHFEDHAEDRRIRYLENAFKAGYRAGRKKKS